MGLKANIANLANTTAVKLKIKLLIDYDHDKYITTQK